MGWIEALVGGLFDTGTTAANIAFQQAENQKSRDFAAQQQEDAQVFNAEEAQKSRDFAAQQQEDAQAFNSQEAALNRDWQSSEAALNRDFQAQQAEEAFNREREFYEQYQSIGAQVRQYEEAGLNPALLAGGVSAGHTPSSSAGAGSMPSGSAASSSALGGSAASSSPLGANASSLPELIGMAKEVFDLQAMKQSIENMRKEGNKIEAETANIEKNTDWIDRLNLADIQQISSNIEVNSSEVQKNLQLVQESMSNIDLNNSKILVNGAEIDLKGNQSILAASQAAVNNLDAQKLEKLMPYIEARMEADIAYTNAKTNTERFDAEDKMYSANIKMLRGMVEAGLIDRGYYDSIVDEKLWDAKSAKREYKWAPINDICSNVSKLAIAGSAVVSSLSGAGVNMVKDVVAPQVSLGFF